MRDTGIFVANSYNGEMFPVDSVVIQSVIYKSHKRYERHAYWSARCQTILDLLLAGF
jgi:hypothetical protein